MTGRMLAVLANLLPGLREVRTPLAVGYISLVSLWLVFGGDIQGTLDREYFLRHVQELHGFLGLPVTLGALSLAAYLVGTILTISPATTVVDGRFARFRRLFSEPRMDTSEILGDYIRMQREFFNEEDAPEPAPGVDAGIFTPAARNVYWDHVYEEGRAENPKYGEYRRLAYMSAMRLDIVTALPQLAVRLGIANADLFNDYDRKRAEAEFRLSVAAPLALLFFILGVQWNPIALVVGVLGPAALLWRGRTLAGESVDILIQAVATETVVAPVVERMRRAREQDADKRHARTSVARTG